MPESPCYRWRLAALVTALILAATAGAGAQTPQLFSDLGRYLPAPPAEVSQAQVPAVATTPPAAMPLGAMGSRVKPGGAISVFVVGGQRIAGKFVKASNEGLALDVGGVERVIPAADVREVVVAHGTNRLKLGAVVGGLMGALIGQSGCYDTPSYANEEKTSCAGGVAASIAGFTAFGMAIGATRWRPAVVFPPPPVAPAPAERVRAEAAAPARPAPTPGPARDRSPAPSLDLLGTRVQPFERIYVHLFDGREISGTFRQAFTTSLQIEEKGETKTIAASDIRKVFLRGGTNGRRGMRDGLAFGTGIGAAIGAMVSPSDGWKTRDNIAAGAIVLGSVGFIYGGLGGLLVHSRSLVYDAEALPRR